MSKETEEILKREKKSAGSKDTTYLEWKIPLVKEIKERE